MNKKKQLAKNTLIIFFGRVCTQLISYFLLPLYTAYLATSEYGLVDLVQTYITLLVPIVTLELEMSVFRYLIDVRGKEKDTKVLMSNNFFILGISLSSFTLLYLIITSFVVIPFRFLILFDAIVCVLSGNFLQIARGFGRTVDFSISCILTGITTILSNIVMICYLHRGAEGMIFSMALANFICALYLFIRIKMYHYIDFSLVDKKLIKEKDRKLARLEKTGNDYKACSMLISGRSRVLTAAFFWNFLQRASQIMVPMLIYASLGGDKAEMPVVFSKQCLITIGYNL